MKQTGNNSPPSSTGFKWGCQWKPALSMEVMNTWKFHLRWTPERASILEGQLVIPLVWPQSDAKVNCDASCCIAIMIFPCMELLFGMQQYGSGCSHLLNESLPPPTHPGTCQDRYSPPRRHTGGEGKLWMTKSCISNHWATWLQRGFYREEKNALRTRGLFQTSNS